MQRKKKSSQRRSSDGGRYDGAVAGCRQIERWPAEDRDWTMASGGPDQVWLEIEPSGGWQAGLNDGRQCVRQLPT